MYNNQMYNNQMYNNQKQRMLRSSLAISPHLDLLGSLTVDTRSAEPGCCQVPHGVPLYIVPGPGLLPQQHGGEAGHDAGQGIVQEPTLLQATSIGAYEAGHAECSTQADAAVTTEVEQSLAPAHPDAAIQ